MPRRTNAKTITFQLTPAQHAAVLAEAARVGQDISRFLRRLLTEAVPGFPDEIPPRGKYDRRRQYVAWCISDGDVVTVDRDDFHAAAWLAGWHRNAAGEEVPAVYRLEVDDEPPRRFETLRELLDAMAEVASFDQWRVEGE